MDIAARAAPTNHPCGLHTALHSHSPTAPTYIPLVGPQYRAEVCSSLADMLYALNRWDEALGAVGEAVEAARQAGEWSLVVKLSNNMGAVYKKLERQVRSRARGLRVARVPRLAVAPCPSAPAAHLPCPCSTPSPPTPDCCGAAPAAAPSFPGPLTPAPCPPRRPDDAEALHRSTYSLALGQLGAGHPLTLLARSNLVEALMGRSMAGAGQGQGQGQAAEEQAAGAEAEAAAAGQAAGDSPVARAAREEARQLLQVSGAVMQARAGRAMRGGGDRRSHRPAVGRRAQVDSLHRTPRIERGSAPPTYSGLFVMEGCDTRNAPGNGHALVCAMDVLRAADLRGCCSACRRPSPS